MDDRSPNPHTGEADPLFDTETNVLRALKPVSPPSAFRARLRDGLMMAAQYKQMPEVSVRSKRADPHWEWLMGAVAIGAALGFVAVLLRTNRGRVRAFRIRESSH